MSSHNGVSRVFTKSGTMVGQPPPDTPPVGNPSIALLSVLTDQTLLSKTHRYTNDIIQFVEIAVNLQYWTPVLHLP
jgi:hypothetical protein